MHPKRTVDAQCTHAEFMQSLPTAVGNRPFEITDNQVIVHDEERRIEITVSEQPIRKLGSLTLPMEKAVFDFIDFSEGEADSFMTHYRQHTMRSGGG